MNPLIPLLRAARSLLGWSQADVSRKFGIKVKTVQRIEGGKYKLLPREAFILRANYQDAGVEFTDASGDFGPGVRWKSPGSKLEDNTLDHFGSRIIRAARSLADLSQRELAEVAKVDPSFIARLEKNKYGAVNEATFLQLQSALRELNIAMIGETATAGAGVCWISAPNNLRN